MAKRRVGYSTRRHMLEPVRPEAVLPDRALCLPSFSHFFIVNKTSLSLSLSLSDGSDTLPSGLPRQSPQEEEGGFEEWERWIQHCVTGAFILMLALTCSGVSYA